MNSLLAHILPLALGAAISPMLLVVQVLVLSGKNKPISRAVAVTVGAGIMLLGLSLAFITLLNGFGQTPPGDEPSAATESVRGIAAIILVILGIRNLMHRDRPPNTTRAKKLAQAKWRDYVAVGVIVMLTNVTTLVLFAPALHIVMNAQVSQPDKIIAYCVLFAITMAPLLIPLLIALAMGKKGAQFLSKLNIFVTKHNAVISAVVCFGFAVYIGYLAVSPYL